MNLILISPLEQFELNLYKKAPWFLEIFNFLSDFGVTIITLLFLIGSLLFIIIRMSQKRKMHDLLIIPSNGQAMFETFILVIGNSIQAQAGFVGLRYIPLIMTTFMYILASNLLGLVPFHFTTTAQVIIPFTLAFTFNLYFIFVSCINLGFLGFLSNFIPTGVPKVLVPFIFAVEILSYLLRTVSLALRLFANLLAGHILLYIIGSFLFVFYAYGFGLVTAGSFLLYFCILILEVLISVIQAYVFAILLTVYISDAISLKH